ncbi:MAG TPA: biotin/lipoyl-containing protein, partial [Actinomycetota bacterium]|nr:biotin/lipoyl-containing protein [Actinomycetota bacterium]
MSEGTITKWMKQPGESIEADEALLEISTDKVDTEVPSPASGVLQEILAQEGETVAVGTKIAVIAPEGSGNGTAPVEAPPEPATAQAAQDAEAAGGAEGETPTAEKVEEAEPAAAETTPTPPPEPAPAAAPQAAGDGKGDKAFVSPVVGRIAAEHGVDVAQVSGTGRGGRVTKKDILGFIESGGAPAAPAAPEAPAAAPAPAPAEAGPSAAPPKPAAVSAPAPTGQTGETVEPMTPMRKGIAEHMRRSLDTAAHVTTTFEIDMSKVVAIREKLKREYQERHGVKLTYLPLISRATIDTIG